MFDTTGDRMIELYYWPTPNGHKITIFSREANLDYRIGPSILALAISSSLVPPDLTQQPNASDHRHEPADSGEPISV